MKRITTLFILLVIGTTLFAAEISQQQAKEKALASMLQRMGGGIPTCAVHR